MNQIALINIGAPRHPDCQDFWQREQEDRDDYDGPGPAHSVLGDADHDFDAEDAQALASYG